MSDPYTPKEYDSWKLATPWDNDIDEELLPCQGCGDPFTQDELNDDDLCHACEMNLLEPEDTEEK